MRKKILVYDCSGSTTQEYWIYLTDLNKTYKFDKFIAWGLYAKNVPSLVRCPNDDIGCGTEPVEALRLVQKEYTTLEGEWELHISTDGSFTQMSENQLIKFVSELTFIEYFKKICVYYIGYLNQMNLFLNHFLCQNEDFVTHVYDIDEEVETFSIQLNEDIDFDNYLVAKIQIQTLLAKYRNQPDVIRQLRQSVVKHYSKREKILINVNVIQNLTAYIEDNEITYTSNFLRKIENFNELSEIEKIFVSRDVDKIYKEFSLNTKLLNETNLLNLFSKDFNYLFRGTIVESKRSNKLAPVKPIKIAVSPKNVEEIDLSTCSIMFEELTSPAIIIKRSYLELSSSEWAQPFQLITYRLESFKQLFELNQINYSTYQKLVAPGSTSFKSPFTREECCGVFVFSLSALEHNCKVLSLAMGKKCKFYGNILNWNLCCFYLLFLLYKIKEDIHMQYIIANQIIELITTKNMSMYWMLSRPTDFKSSIINTLWFNINFSIQHIKSKNCLFIRKWGYAFFQFYNRFVRRYQTPYGYKVNECFVWAWLVREKTDIWNLVHKLYNFKRTELPIFILNNKNLTYFLFKNYLNKNSKLTDIPELNNFNPYQDITLEFPVIKIPEINKEYHDDLLKIEIDPQTCLPSEICCHKNNYKNCKNHVQLEFEFKKAISFFKIFALFCIEKEHYPKNPAELFEFYKSIIYNYLQRNYIKKGTPFKVYPVFVFDDILKIITDVYGKYQTITNDIDVATFIHKYNNSNKSKYKKKKSQ